MVVESTSPQTLNSNKKPNKLRSIRFPRLSFLKKTSSKFSCLSIDPTSDNNSTPEKLSPVPKMPDLSPNYMKITTSYDAKKGSNSQRGVGSVDVISVDSSDFCTQKKDDKIKNRPVMKKIMKNFGSTRSFRRRSSRSIATIKNHSPAKSQSDSVDQFSESSTPPHYRKSTSCSEGKSCSHSTLHHSCESSFDSSDQSRSPRKFSQTLSRTNSMRSVKILINKASFKSKRGTSKCCQIPDKATCSSTIKDSKFKEHVEFHHGQTESDRMSKFKVCSYHHCSLHGGHYDDPSPPVKRVYRRKRLLKSQKSIRAKREFTVDENAQLSSSLDPSVCEQSSDAEAAGVFDVNEAIGYVDLAETDFGEKQSSCTKDAAFFKVNEAIGDAGLAEIAFGETSFPEQSYKETLNIMSKYSACEQGSLLTASKCCNCMERGRSDSKDDSVTASAASCLVEERNLPILSKQDNGISTSGKGESNKRELSKDGSFTISTRPVFDLFNGAKCSNITASAAKSGNDESNNRELSKDGPFTITTRPVFDFFYGAKCSNEISSVSASNMQEKDGKADPNEDLDSTSGPVGGSESKNCPPVEVAEPKKKYMNMWSLIRRHMVSDASAEPENKLGSGANDEENHLDGANKSPSAESSDLCSDFSEREMIPANEDAESQEVELRKLFTIKLVREAIEKILLPEVQSDNQSVTSESSVDQESFEMNQIQDIKNEEADAGSKSKTPNTEDLGGSKKERTWKEVKNKSEKNAPKHWSNLKKWILLQRFVKELEKVRKINPRKPCYLQLNPDPEAEKVNLRTQTADERKRGEEWMLDYALQQAISQLAPTQQRKVELLIKAFETVVPPQGDNSQIAFPKLRARGEDHLQITTKQNEIVFHKAEEVVPGIDRKREENDCSMYKNHDVQQSILRQKSDEVTRALSDDALVEGKARKEDQEDSSSDSRKEIPSSISSLTDAVDGAQDVELENHDGVISETSNITHSSISDGEKNSLTEMSIQSSTSASDAALQENVAMEETAKECERTPKRVRGFSLLLSMSDLKEEDGASKGQADKRSYISMWHMISQHVLSDVASKVGNELLDGTDDEVEDSSTPSERKTCNSLQDFSETKDDAETSREDHNPRQHRRSFCRDDAVKLIREAVNEILTTPIQDDSSDTQSVTSDIIPDQELSEAEGEANNSSNSTESLTNLDMTEGGKTLDQETKDPKEERELPLAKNKPETQKSKNWSKLKKLILLKRSIKALERARKFNPRAPNLLPLTPDQEPEKVDLRHQMTDERKKAEKWMLDYAMQNLVTTLTPARKKRVAMLVEAFEAVVPLPEV